MSQLAISNPALVPHRVESYFSPVRDQYWRPGTLLRSRLVWSRLYNTWNDIVRQLGHRTAARIPRRQEPAQRRTADVSTIDLAVDVP